MSNVIQPNAIGSVVPPFGAGAGGGGPPTGPAGGDLSGTYPAPIVVGLQGTPIDPAAPSPGDHLIFDGVDWTPTPAAAAAAIISGPGAYTVPAAVAVGDAVYVTGAFTADRADASSPATAPAIGIVIAKPLATTATVAYFGEVTVLAGLTPGGEYFLDTSVGAITLTAPTLPGQVVQRIGIAVSATVLVLNPDPTTTEL